MIYNEKIRDLLNNQFKINSDETFIISYYGLDGLTTCLGYDLEICSRRQICDEFLIFNRAHNIDVEGSYYESSIITTVRIEDIAKIMGFKKTGGYVFYKVAPEIFNNKTRYEQLVEIFGGRAVDSHLTRYYKDEDPIDLENLKEMYPDENDNNHEDISNNYEKLNYPTPYECDNPENIVDIDELKKATVASQEPPTIDELIKMLDDLKTNKFMEK